MPTPDQTRRALEFVTSRAVTDAQRLIQSSAERTRDALLADLPAVVAYYSDGTAALAADHYDDLRDEAGAARRYTAEPVVRLREEKLLTGALWTIEPLFQAEPDRVLAASRLAEVVQFETARPFRDTITVNTRRDPAARGWQRITSGNNCKFCSMLAARGAVYRAETAHFASHPHCNCSAAPVFAGQRGQPANPIQQLAAQRKRTPAQQQRLRAYLAALPD